MANRRRKGISIAAFIVLIAGLGVLFYPQLHDLHYQRQIGQLKKEFMRDDGSRFDELYALLKEKNELLFIEGQSGLVDAFSYERPAIDLSDYGIRDNCIGFIFLPSIKIELPVYLGANTENMLKGAVHMTQTSYPIGGDNTNSVIAAHRGRSVRQFREIDKIEIGDEVIIMNFRETLTYRAAEIKIIYPNAVEEVLIQHERDLITLISCHPLGNNYQRYVVYCERI